MKPTLSLQIAFALVITAVGLPWVRGQSNPVAEDLRVVKPGGTPFIRVALEGISGEAASALRFDLEVQGFEFTAVDQAQYLVSGASGERLVGRFTDRVSKATLLSREYTGGTVRSQAHKLADDIVGLFPGGQGIASRKIVVRADTGKNNEIYVADYDGHNAVQVTRDNVLVRDPVWSPGRRLIYYTSYKSGYPYIYSHDLQNGVRRVVAGYGGLNGSPAVSPDGGRLAMILSRSGSPDLWLSDADGGNPKRLTTTHEDESSPCWSPDGRTVCVVSRKDGRAKLYLVSASGGALRPITTAGVLNTTEPSWSPDGKWIAFTTTTGGFQICVVPAAGGSAEVLTAGEDPSWGPNSRTILFTRRSGGRRVVSLLDVPTKRVKDIRQISGSCSQPDWAR